MVALTCCLFTFPISLRDPAEMEILGYTDTETLLWDYSQEEDYFVLAQLPANVPTPPQTLFRVGIRYAYQWFGLNGRNNLRTVYYPFDQINFTGLTDPCACEHQPPVVTSITPNFGIVAQSIVVGGLYFTGATLVTFSGVPAAFTVIDSQTIDVIVPVDTGTVDIQVVTPYGISAITPADQFTYIVVQVTSVTPDMGTATIPVVVGGLFFTGATSVTFGGVPASSFSVIDMNTIDAVVPIGTGTVDVQVTTPFGTSAINPPFDQFTYTVVSTVTWDPVTILDVVLSNGNLINTNTGNFDADGDPQGAKVTGVLSSGKYYFEVNYVQDNNVRDEFALGIGSAGGNYNGFNYASGAYGAVLFGPNFFNIYADSQYTGQNLVTQGVGASGDVFAIAVNLDAGLVWFQCVAGPDVDPTNGWNGENGDPATDLNGISIPPGLKTIFGSYADGDPTESLTLNFSGPFSGTIPSGYTAGWPSTAFVPSIMGAVWDSSTATNVTVSTGGPGYPPPDGAGYTISDLLATNLLNGPGPPGGALGTVNTSTGRLYFEVTITDIGATSNLFNVFNIGIGDDLGGIGSYTSVVNKFQGGFGFDSRGAMYVNGNVSPTDSLGHTLQTGDILGVAIDYTSGFLGWVALVGGPSYHAPTVWRGHTTFSGFIDGEPFTTWLGQSLPGGSHVPIIAWGDTDNTRSATFNLSGPFVQYLGTYYLNPASSVGGTASLSNNRLTLTATNNNSVFCRSSGIHNNNSFWFEITLGSTYTGAYTTCGIATNLFDSFLDAQLTRGTNAFIVYTDGSIGYNNTTPSIALGALNTGDVLQFAVQFGSTSKIWVRINRGGTPQNWNGDPTANPSTNTNGFDISALFNNSSASNAAYVVQTFSSSGSFSTVNFGQTTFVTNPPLFPAWSNNFTDWSGTLDPAKAIETTLSNGNLTATNDYPPTAEQGVEVATISGKTSGKYYFEVTYAINMDADTSIGVAVVGSDYVQFNLNGLGGVSVTVSGKIYANGSLSSYSLSRMNQLDVIGFAVDLDNNAVWVKTVDGSDYYNGKDWNGLSPGGADPATNLNGISLVSGTIVPIVAFSANMGDLAGNAVNANFGQYPFAGLTPAGFTSGWPT